MKTINFKKGIVLVFTILLSTMAGFSQDDKRTEAAKEAASALTGSMVETLKLTSTQSDSVGQYNQSYALVLFTTVPLTEDAIKEFDYTLDTNLKGVFNEEQYSVWTENKDTWLNMIKSKIPKEDPIEQ
ncbi:hypothetical protein JGH11_08585 [Dysgonomonas sp. Marseille-P4677]|uniref:hypothetical protein n=1 Tax=Dysgonomonas sp. Marseille-P4677 TaxID=2364790 RepID=UPI00191462FD|nr:hypothetical protein [Dysgonomonas sp. Marseille-P4677]MBK5720925.1 hypothetical protein [Dysgonomonas sp. Marseille-P4677]